MRAAIKPASRAEFVKAMQEFANDQKADIEMVAREQMRLMMRDAMTFSAPMPKGGGQGLSQAAWKAGKNKLGNDVRRIFIPIDNIKNGRPVIIRQIINAVKGNDTQTYFQIHQNITASKIKSLRPIMQKIMEDTDWQRSMKKAKNYFNKTGILVTSKVQGMATDLRSIHNQAKGVVGGRWPKNQPYRGAQYFASSEAVLAAYIAERQQKVGWIKAGYADALSKIPLPVYKGGATRNFGAYDAPWVDANRSNYGTFSIQKTSGGSAVAMTAGNNIGNINGVADESDVKNIVYGNRVQNIQSIVASRNADSIERANRRNK